MKIPVNLKHKPVIAVNDYANIDAHHYPNTDAKGLSLGLAQWNDRGRVDVSAKVWRYVSSERWSRQSEELPLYRVIDLAILIAKSIAFFRDAYRRDALYDKNAPQIERVGLEGDAFTMEVCTDNPYIDEDIERVRAALCESDEGLSEHLHLLANTLRALGYGTNAQ